MLVKSEIEHTFYELVNIVSFRAIAELVILKARKG